jgi:hypothetical protein
MNDPTPPPERPLPDGSRARIRADLLGHAHENRSPAPRWLVPAGAAAAVALVAGVGYWAISPGGNEADQTPVGGGGSASGAPATSSPTADQTVVPTAPTAPIEVATGSCPEELPNVLPGAELALDFPAGHDDGTTSFYVKGDRFVLCDIREGTTTVQQPMRLTPLNDATTYAVSSLFLGGPGHRAIRVGGGIVPAGAPAFDVAYTFPDGHTERATQATDEQGRTWWRMVYAYDDGGGNEMDKAPIEVTVSFSGAQHHYTLAWGLYTCAQANHGC